MATSLIVAFDLKNPKEGDYRRAYSALADLGFTAAAQGIELPTTTTMGVWWDDATMDVIRGAILNKLLEAGVTPSHLLVAEYTTCAFFGEKVSAPPRDPPPRR